jgi:lysozyme family protein
MDRFDTFIERVFKDEGGYSNDPKDPGNWTGGRVGSGVLKGTKFGIAANTYGHLDIANLTRAEAKEIYRRDFWHPIRGDKLPPIVGAMMLNVAVNTGIGRASKFLQRAVGVPDDGKLGPVTLGAVQATDANDIGFLFVAHYLDFLNDLDNWTRYGRGWSQRVVELLFNAAKDN